MLISDIAHEYNWLCLFIALTPLLFFFKMQKRERSWIIALVGVYLCIGGLLVILMNPQPERQSADLIRVFFTSSHAVIAIMIGYGFALTAAYISTHYQRFRPVALMAGVAALAPALTAFYEGVNDTFYGGQGFVPYHYVLLIFVLLAAALTLTAQAARTRLRLSAAKESDNPSDPTIASERRWFLVYAGSALVLLCFSLAIVFLRADSLSLAQINAGLSRMFAPEQYSLPAIAGVLTLGIVVAFLASLLIYRERAPLAVTLGLIGLMPLASALSHWAASEQRGHWFGYWFGHDMFTPPITGPDGKMTYDAKVRAQMMKGPNGNLVYPEMDRHTILYGGTDPGRFNPTYMIFCGSFIPNSCKPKADPVFDRRDVYLITQNALADPRYLDYLRAQYFRSRQNDPPFFSELARFVLKDKEYQTNLLAKMVSPLDWFFEARGAREEKRWRTSTSRFTEKDFLDVPALVAKLCPGGAQDALSKWLFENCSKQSQELIASRKDEARLLPLLTRDLDGLLERELRQGRQPGEKVDPLYEPTRFAHVAISDYLKKFIAENPQSNTRIRLNRLLLEAAFPREIAKSIGGVYPDREIYIASPDDLSRVTSEYASDATRRAQHDQQFPNEPKQVRPGEGVTFTPDGRVLFSGTVSVMGINALLTKVIFDRNPDNEFYVEESFPLEWMFPHLTPYGIIMKINRQPVTEITDEVCRRDHEFWSKYSERLIGNWITYDTSVKEITEFVEQVYLNRNFKGFTGDRRFVRDEQAQKSFSKLRSSIGGIYSWRLGLTPASGPPRYMPKSEAERARIFREADFAYKQAFAFCPYSPEVVMRYVNLLASAGRLPDAILVAETCSKLDPYNEPMRGIVANLRNLNQQVRSRANID
jgi:hypothetical protein